MIGWNDHPRVFLHKADLTGTLDQAEGHSWPTRHASHPCCVYGGRFQTPPVTLDPHSDVPSRHQHTQTHSNSHGSWRLEGLQASPPLGV